MIEFKGCSVNALGMNAFRLVSGSLPRLATGRHSLISKGNRVYEIAGRRRRALSLGRTQNSSTLEARADIDEVVPKYLSTKSMRNVTSSPKRKLRLLPRVAMKERLHGYGTQAQMQMRSRSRSDVPALRVEGCFVNKVYDD